MSDELQRAKCKVESVKSKVQSGECKEQSAKCKVESDEWEYSKEWEGRMEYK